MTTYPLIRPLQRASYTVIRKALFGWLRKDIGGTETSALGIDHNKPICYVIQNRALSDLMVLEQACIDSQLPRPINEPHEDLQGHNAYVYLTRTRGYFLQRDSLRAYSTRLTELVQLVENTPSLDIQIVPVSIFWGRLRNKENSIIKTLLSDNWALTNRLKRLFAIFIHGRSTYVQFDKPISLRQLTEQGLTTEKASHKLARVLRVHFNRVRTTVIGPDLSHRRTMVDNIVHSAAVQKVIHADKKHPPEKLLAEAKNNAKEIASDYSYVTTRLFYKLLTWIWNKLYDGITINNIENLHNISKGNTVIYVPCHRSHIDYLLMSYVLYSKGLMLPHIAAGINLNLPVVGKILRSCGAFFIRRSFTNKLYTAVFTEYLHSLQTKGYSIEYFIEGGRSRTGRLLQPRTGMLSMTVRSFLREQKKPIVFMPINFSYERVMEDKTYLRELRGKAKKKESFADITKTWRRLKQPFGKAHVNFGEPIALADLLNQHQPNWKEQDYGDEFKPKWLADFTNNAANEISTRINSCANANSINLVCLALLASDKQSMHKDTLTQQLELYRQLLTTVNYSDNATTSKRTAQQMIEHASAMQLLEDNDDSDIISFKDNTAEIMTYYRNNIVHLFSLSSLITSIALIKGSFDKARLIRICESLYPYLKQELFLNRDENNLEASINEYLKALVKLDVLEKKKDDKYSINKNNITAASLLSRIITPALERFYIVLNITQQSDASHSAGELEKNAHKVAKQMAALHELHSPEYYDRSLFKQFIHECRQQEMLSINTDNKVISSTAAKTVLKNLECGLNNVTTEKIKQLVLASAD